MGIGCFYKIIFGEPEEKEPEIKFPNKGAKPCCRADNIELKFATRSGDLFYAYLVCKTCGNKFTYTNGEE